MRSGHALAEIFLDPQRAQVRHGKGRPHLRRWERRLWDDMIDAPGLSLGFPWQVAGIIAPAHASNKLPLNVALDLGYCEPEIRLDLLNSNPAGNCTRKPRLHFVVRPAASTFSLWAIVSHAAETAHFRVPLAHPPRSRRNHGQRRIRTCAWAPAARRRADPAFCIKRPRCSGARCRIWDEDAAVIGDQVNLMRHRENSALRPWTRSAAAPRLPWSACARSSAPPRAWRRTRSRSGPHRRQTPRCAPSRTSPPFCG